MLMSSAAFIDGWKKRYPFKYFDDADKAQPQYVIEALCTPDSSSSLGGVGCPKYYYRITARGYGGNSNTQITLQMVVRL